MRAAANLTKANLREANLAGANLRGAHLMTANLQAAVLSGANLMWANFSDAILQKANLTGAKLLKASFIEAYLSKADFTGADLTQVTLVKASLAEANLSRVNATMANFGGAGLFMASLRHANLAGAYLSAGLRRTDFTRANLKEANLEGAHLVETDFTGADLTGCRVYGISAWDLKLDGTKQNNLIIRPPRDEPGITVDNLEVAQFIYLLLNNERIRHVIDTITSKVVLILGRFEPPERKAVLDAIREELRQRDYTPVLFDFKKPAGKSLTGTIKTLANMARFVIADLTDPSSIAHELAMVVPTTRVPIQPILLEGEREYAMLVDLKADYRWVLETYSYASPERLIADLSKVIGPAEAKAKELRGVSPPT